MDKSFIYTNHLSGGGGKLGKPSFFIYFLKISKNYNSFQKIGITL